VGFYLSLGFHHKPQAHRFAQVARGKPKGKSTGIPKWVKQGWPVAKLTKPLAGPCEVVGFFGARTLKKSFELRGWAGERLCGVKGLGAYLSHMVYAH
jgi:hypothetical protein